MLHIIFAGLPTTTLPSGIVPFTTAPAPIIQFLPITVFGSIVTRNPIKTFSAIVIQPSLRASVFIKFLLMGG